MPALQSLPIDPSLPAIVAAVRERGVLVLSAEPGAGKTTRVPRALLDAGFAERGEILVLEPRRIATRMAARRVASELGEEVGQRIGYQVRFEEAISARTRVKFITEGLLTRKLVTDPELRSVSCVVLDEFHERHIHGDVGLAWLRRLRLGPRKDLSLVVMSATLAAERLAGFLDAPVISVPGRVHPVTVEYSDPPSGTAQEPPLETRVAGAIRRLVREGVDGDVLVFLPGAAEIRRAEQACAAVAKDADFELALLHGDLPARDQDRAVTRGSRRKIILSTNVAETSLTIEGVRAVVDSGLARVAGHSPFSGLPTLVTAPISRASATQRAGRAGRLGPGRCIRLYTKHDHDTRPEHDKPEIARIDLTETRLSLAVSGAELSAEDWLDAPPENAWQAARELLVALMAFDDAGKLTALGREVARYPLHPRLARLMLEANARGAGASGCLLAALLGERDVLQAARARFDGNRRDHETSNSDLLLRLSLIESAGERADASRLRSYDLDPGAVASVLRVRDRLERMLDAVDDHGRTEDQRDEALQMATLAGFCDRVGRRRAPKSSEVVLAAGGAATLAPASVVRDAEYMVIVDASERRGTSRAVMAHLASAIEPEWLLELFPERIAERTELEWNPKTERVEGMLTLSYAGLALDRVRRDELEPVATARVLRDAALAHGIEHFIDRDALAALRERLTFAASIDPTLALLPEDAAERALAAACEGRRSFEGLREVSLLDFVYAELPPGARARIAALTPDHVMLPQGRKLEVHYERGKPPWVESRLQDFFGLKDGPRIGGKPVVLHLLAPNKRAVQVTTDLAGFWTKHYPEVRRELSRRYPRHSWPDDPRNAEPLPPTPRRRH